MLTRRRYHILLIWRWLCNSLSKHEVALILNFIISKSLLICFHIYTPICFRFSLYLSFQTVYLAVVCICIVGQNLICMITTLRAGRGEPELTRAAVIIFWWTNPRSPRSSEEQRSLVIHNLWGLRGPKGKCDQREHVWLTAGGFSSHATN